MGLELDARTVEVDVQSEALSTRVHHEATIVLPSSSATDAAAEALPGLMLDTASAEGLAFGASAPASEFFSAFLPLLPGGILSVGAGVRDGQFRLGAPGTHQVRFDVASFGTAAYAPSGDLRGTFSTDAAALGLFRSMPDAGSDAHLARAASDAPVTSEEHAADGDRTLGARANAAQPAASRDMGRAAALAAAATAGLGLMGLAGFAMYHRLRGHQTLTNDTRKAIYDLICEKPGVGVKEIAKTAGVSYSTASYHLDRLASNRMIVAGEDGNKLRYYKNGGAFTPEERQVLPILKNREAFRLLKSIIENPGTYRAALADALGVTPTTINWHLKRLRAANLVVEEREGRNAYLSIDLPRLTECVAPLVEKLQDGEAAERARDVLRLTPAAPPSQGNAAVA